jgi:hypothetical protein
MEIESRTKEEKYPNFFEMQEIYKDFETHRDILVKYRKQKTKSVILNNESIIKLIENTKKYYNLSSEIPSVDDVKKYLFQFIIQLNTNPKRDPASLFYVNDRDELGFQYDIFKFEMIMDRDLLQKEFETIFKLSSSGDIKYFFLYQLLNSLTLTTSLFFNFDISNKIVLNPLSKHFEVEGNYFYNLYYQEKYKSKICTTFPTFEEFINELENNYNKFLKTKSDEYKLAYEYRVLNCNIFVSDFLRSVLSKQKKYVLGVNVKDNAVLIKTAQYVEPEIKKCLEGNMEFIVVPMTIKYDTKEEKGDHENLLLMDTKNKIVERYDPHGLLAIEKRKKLNEELKEFFSDLGYTYATEYCKADPIQNLEVYGQKTKKKIPEYFTGRCVSYSYNYLDYRLNEESSEIALRKYSSSTYKEKGIHYMMDIVLNNNKIFDSLQDKLDTINDIFGSKLKFNGNSLISGGECSIQNGKEDIEPKSKKTKISPRTPQISPQTPPISPRTPQISPRTPQISPRSPPESKKPSTPRKSSRVQKRTSRPVTRSRKLVGVTKRKGMSKVFTGPRGGLYIKKGNKKIYL